MAYGKTRYESGYVIYKVPDLKTSNQTVRCFSCNLLRVRYYVPKGFQQTFVVCKFLDLKINNQTVKKLFDDCVYHTTSDKNGLFVFEDIPMAEFMYLVFTRMQGKSYRRRLRSLLLYLCYAFRALINSLVCWFYFKQADKRIVLLKNTLNKNSSARNGLWITKESCSSL